ncbi:unnamed protein product [Vicia faba]|uniref:Uncharacterized protein n=1 Tax=Vicia faba TaxID=3906 RepID=A0AAV1A6X9_VICFA|nr:unnamed protein product [Vicia faba]
MSFIINGVMEEPVEWENGMLTRKEAFSGESLSARGRGSPSQPLSYDSDRGGRLQDSPRSSLDCLNPKGGNFEFEDYIRTLLELSWKQDNTLTSLLSFLFQLCSDFLPSCH